MTKRVLNNLKLRAIAAVDEPCQAPALVAIMKSADVPDRVAKARADFAGIAASIATRDRVPQHVAMAKARQEQPGAFEAAYCADEGRGVSGDPLEPTNPVNKARSALVDLARDIAAKKGIPRHLAMQKARQERPDLFESL
jgi:hypothetical protein